MGPPLALINSMVASSTPNFPQGVYDVLNLLRPIEDHDRERVHRAMQAVASTEVLKAPIRVVSWGSIVLSRKLISTIEVGVRQHGSNIKLIGTITCR